MVYVPTHPNEPAFQTRRSVYEGDFVRGGGPEPTNSAFIRYGPDVSEALTESLFVSRPVGYDAIQVWWGVPPEAFNNEAVPWSIIAVVRSGFGYPITPADGEVILGLEGNRASEEVPGTVVDDNLPSGRWFYYSLMFRIGSRWYVAGKTAEIIPHNYGHGEKMYSLLPPYHQYVDSQYSGGGESVLRRMCDTVGYDLDLSRTLVEQVDNIYDTDSSPSQFLSLLGSTNLGFDLDEAVGTIRYRSLLSANRTLSDERGTAAGLAHYIEAITKYSTIASDGLNELLLVDDAEFLNGTGNWAPLPYGIGREVVAHSTASTKPTTPTGRPTLNTLDTTIQVTPFGENGAPDQDDATLPARSMVKVVADNDFAVSIGSGRKTQVVGNNAETATPRLDFVHMNPEWRGIPVVAEEIYYFTFWMYREVGDTEACTTEYGLSFYDSTPSPEGFEANVTGGSVSSVTVDDLVAQDLDYYTNRLITVTSAVNGDTSTDPTGLLHQTRLITSAVDAGGGSTTFNITPDWPEVDTFDVLPQAGDKVCVRSTERRGFSDGFWGSSSEPGFNSYPALIPLDFDDADFAAVTNGTDDEWAQFTMSVKAPVNARFAVPIIWIHNDGAPPANDTRYFTAAMVSKSQGVGNETVYQPSSYIKLRADETPPDTADAQYPDDVLSTTTKVIGE